MTNADFAQDLLEATIPDIHNLFRKCALTPSKLVEFYLRRVQDHDLDVTSGPPFNSVVSICPGIREQALQIDAEIAADGISKPLQGIPIWVKDCIDVAGLPTSAGCLSLANDPARSDAELVRALRGAGALILGKAGMTELSRKVIGYGSLSTLIGNAYDPRSQPGGSSNGCAVAIALNFGMGAVGIDDLASVTWPSALNNLAGFRPTVGRIDRAGVFGFSRVDTTPGPMARTMGDLRRILEVLEGGRGEESPDSFTIAGARIGVLETIGSLELASRTPDSLQAAFAQRLRDLEEAGATLVRGVRLDRFQRQRMSQYDYHNSLVRSLRRRARAPRTPHQLLHSPGTGPLCRKVPSLQRLKFTFRIPDLKSPRYRRQVRRNQNLLRSTLHAAGVDLLIAPTLVGTSWLSTLASVPHVTVPAGFHRIAECELIPDLTPGSELPWGISVLGLPEADRLVLDCASELEALIQARRSPVVSEVGGSARPPLDISAFNRWRLELAERLFGSLVLDGRGGYAHPTPDEFRRLLEPLLAERVQ